MARQRDRGGQYDVVEETHDAVRDDQIKEQFRCLGRLERMLSTLLECFKAMDIRNRPRNHQPNPQFVEEEDVYDVKDEDENPFGAYRPHTRLEDSDEIFSDTNSSSLQSQIDWDSSSKYNECLEEEEEIEVLEV
ncbi:hypothetical protein TEA_020393 [Camellia sinensis var. sinensis]|uniref:Uncharacterized protein n=1 Tax=Camellia sinensis var. sinensis TaxID=542762 RepID=A0A4S4ESG0_CAMSN|nr:hypothetical protein TEA_020393 [Camellia sinensis var. sinensis]